jgi:predicted RNA methylase
MKLKELQALMQDMEPFDRDRLKVELEQYPTGADIASRMLFTVRVVVVFFLLLRAAVAAALFGQRLAQ